MSAVTVQNGEVRQDADLRTEGASIVLTVPSHVVQNTPLSPRDSVRLDVDGAAIRITPDPDGNSRLRSAGRNSTVVTITAEARTLGLEDGDTVSVATPIDADRIEVRDGSEE